MAKSSQAFRTIREVADWLDVAAHVLRFWESKFPQIKPVKRAGGRRYYRPGDMELVGGIKVLLHEQGMTIKGVQALLKAEGVGHVSALAPPLDLDDVDAEAADAVGAWEGDLADEASATAADIEDAEVLPDPQPVPEIGPDAPIDPVAAKAEADVTGDDDIVASTEPETVAQPTAAELPLPSPPELPVRDGATTPADSVAAGSDMAPAAQVDLTEPAISDGDPPDDPIPQDTSPPATVDMSVPEPMDGPGQPGMSDLPAQDAPDVSAPAAEQTALDFEGPEEFEGPEDSDRPDEKSAADAPAPQVATTPERPSSDADSGTDATPVPAPSDEAAPSAPPAAPEMPALMADFAAVADALKSVDPATLAVAAPALDAARDLATRMAAAAR
ncbi:MAG: MerR family transcriptional regulator [Pseudomonadota bacterium]